MSVRAEYFVGFEWSTSASCPFQLDISTLDNSSWPLWRAGESVCWPDYPAGPTPTPPGGGSYGPGEFSYLWDMTPVTVEVSAQRGRDGNLDAWPMGSCTVALTDPAGDYNPSNKLSPFWPTIRPGRDVVVLMKHAGGWEGVFRGTIRDIEHQPSSSQTVVTVVDDFYRLSRVEPSIPAMADADVGEIMRAIAYACGLNDDALLDFDPGPKLLSWSAKGEKSGLALIKDLLDVYRGWFFVDRSGVLRWIDVMGTTPEMGSAGYVPSPDVGAKDVGELLATKVIEFSPAVSLDNLRNVVVVRSSITGIGDVEQRAEDSASVDLYGELVASYSVEGDLVTGPDQLQDLAEYLLSLWGGLNPPVRNMMYVANEGTELMTATESLDVSSIVQVLDDAGDLQEFVVQSIDHRIGLGAHVHEVNTTLVRSTSEDNTALLASQGKAAS